MEDTKITAGKEMDDTIVEHVSKLHKDYEEILSGYKQELNNFNKQYKSIPTRKYHKKAKANVFVPETFRAIETLMSDIYQIIFSEDPFFALMPKNEISENITNKVASLMYDQLDKIHFKLRQMQNIRSWLINGTIIAKYFWDYVDKVITETKYIQNPETGVLERKTVNVVKVLKDYPNYKLENLLDITIDPYCESVDDADWIILRKRFSFAELKKWEKSGYIENVDLIKDISTKNRKDKIDELKEQRLSDMGFNSPKSQSKDYIVLEYWGKILKQHLDIKLMNTDEGKEEISGHFIICNKVVLRKKENVNNNKEIPCISCSLFPDGEIFSMSIPCVSASSQQTLNDSHNQMQDHRTFSLFHMWLKGKKSGASRSDFKKEPDKVIDCEDVTQVREIVPDPNAMQTAIITEKTAREDIRNVTAATSGQQGIQTTGKITATESNQLYAQSSARVRMLAISYAEQFIKPLLENFLELNKQYITDNKTVKIESKNESDNTLTPQELLQGDYEAIPKVMTDALNPVTVRENLITMLGMVVKTPVPAGSPPYMLMRKIYEMFKFKDVDEIFPLSQQGDGGIIDGNQGIEQGIEGVTGTVTDGTQTPVAIGAGGVGSIP
ncbi:MAG: hypothetical protein PHH73_00150 [Candidatus Rickettsiella isopodorum]|nr:hypothetical protein [Candidatus Rickettsiella isopodorum]